MKLPNGYGSIFKLSGNRRKPWAVRLTIGWENDGKQKYKYLGYYKTRKDAMTALASYNNNPYDLEAGKITFDEMYNRFKEERFPKMSKSSRAGYSMAYNYAEPLYNMRFNDIRKSDMQRIIDNCDKSHGTKRKIKILFNQLYKHALENDLTHKDYARFVELPRNNSKSSRKPFTAAEINLLWENVNRLENVELALIMIYSGLRPGELVEIETKKVNIEERYMRGGFKTEAGTNRIIPIHKAIHHIIEKRMKLNNKYLISTYEGEKMSYYTLYHERWSNLMEQLELNHKPHDCRHTFATLMDNAGANKSSIRRIMGHAGKDITDKVYTHKDIEQLIIAIDTLKQ